MPDDEDAEGENDGQAPQDDVDDQIPMTAPPPAAATLGALAPRRRR